MSTPLLPAGRGPRRGGQPRIHKNTLVFLAPDLDRVDTLDSVLRRKIAWESIRKRVKELNLDQHNITVVENRLAQDFPSAPGRGTRRLGQPQQVGRNVRGGGYRHER